MESTSLLQRYGTYLLVFAAIALLIYIIVIMIQSFHKEHTERKIKNDHNESMANTIYYFVNRSTLSQIQLSWGILLAASVMAVLIFAKVSNPFIIMGAGAVMFMSGLFLPYLYYASKVKKRAAAFSEGMLDFAMGMTSALRAGQALPQAIEVFTRRCDAGPLKEELLIVQREYRLGVDLATAMEHMYNRIPCEDLQLLVVSIRLTTQSGGSMADVLERMTHMIRSRTDFIRKLNALTAQGRFEALAMSAAPLVAFLLLFCINNELMLPMIQTAIGWCALGVMLTLEVIGYFVIRGIVNIEV